MLQMKLASVKLAMKYMKRVSAELETVGGGPEEEELIVQGVRFAFRVHQVKIQTPKLQTLWSSILICIFRWLMSNLLVQFSSLQVVLMLKL